MSEEAIIVRKLTKDDIDAVLEVDRVIVGKERVPSWPQKAASHLETYYPPLCHVAEAGGKVVGFILGDVRGAEYGLPLSGWVDMVGVHPEYQRRGLGRMLAEAFVRECHRRGLKTRAIIREDDERVQKYLLSLGFRKGPLVQFEK